jgi:hypothetical protein
MGAMLHHGFDFSVQQFSGQQTAVAISAFHLHPGTSHFIPTVWAKRCLRFLTGLDIRMITVSAEQALIKSVEGRK